MKKTILFFAAASLMLATSCKKEEPEPSCTTAFTNAFVDLPFTSFADTYTLDAIYTDNCTENRNEFSGITLRLGVVNGALWELDGNNNFLGAVDVATDAIMLTYDSASASHPSANVWCEIYEFNASRLVIEQSGVFYVYLR